MRSEKPDEEQDREDVRFIAEKGHLTPEVFIVKLADRLHNMRTIDSVPDEDKRRKKADETLRVYTKLAREMGMWEVKRELEDLSFPYVHPEIFKSIKDTIDEDPRISKGFAYGMKSLLKHIFSENGIDCEVEARINGYWNLYNKKEEEALAGKGPVDSFSNINDLVSFRVITSDSNPESLYKLLGQVHTSPVLGPKVDYKRFDDFVSQPRDNGYSALQTTLYSEYGAVEIAFVTEEMEEYNKQGIIYSIRKGENLERYKRNIVFDEKGEAWFLPLDATYIDYVYMTGMGSQACTVLVDGIKTPLEQISQNAVNITIIRHEERKRAPDPNFLNHCSPSTAKIISEELNLHEHDRLVEKGKKSMESILKPRGLLDLNDLPDIALSIIFSLKMRDLYELYYQVGGNRVKLQEIADRLDKEGVTKSNLGLSTIRVGGKNKPGIISNLSSLINNNGGDIYKIHQPPIEKSDDTYTLRIVVEGLSEEQENHLRETLTKDERFESVLVV